MAVTAIDHIEIIVHDLEAAVEMFTKLGFQVLARTPHHEGSVELQLPGENQPIFEIHQVIGEENPGIVPRYSCHAHSSAFSGDYLEMCFRELGDEGLL